MQTFPQQAPFGAAAPKSAPVQTQGQPCDKACLKLVKPPKFELRPMH